MQGYIGWQNRPLASNAIVNSRLTECHGCWHVIFDFVGSSMHLPIRLSGSARYSGWIEWAGEAFL